MKREVDDRSSDDSENERTKDLQERDEFASRLKQKDSERTRKVMSKSDQKVRRVALPCTCCTFSPAILRSFLLSTSSS